MTHILHADLDAFYAAVEQLDNPDLRGKPILVGGRPEGRGVVATASYEARKYGVGSAMPMSTALGRCPDGIVVKPRFDRYKEISSRVMSIFRDSTEIIEPLSLDEAYLDITSVVEAGLAPLAVALDLKRRVHSETGLTLSVGVATCKSVAKIASDMDKPDGLVVVPPGEERAFLAALPVSKLPGIGPKAAQRLRRDGIETIGQLAALPEDLFRPYFGKRGVGIRDRALGQDREGVHTERETKSVGSETTFAPDIGDPNQLHLELARLTHSVARHLEHKSLAGKTVTVKLRLSNFTTFTRQTTLANPTRSEGTIIDVAGRLLSNELKPGRAFRLLGVGVSNFGSAQQLQLPLMDDPGTLPI